MTKKELKMIDLDNNTHNYYINNPIGEELKSIQRSIALLRRDLPNIVHDELIRILKEKDI
jgi:hypothetical protein